MYPKISICTLTLLALGQLTTADTLNVPGDFPFIQTAIDAAQNGDSVVVEAGTYSERIDFLGKAISISSVSGSSNTIIDGSASGTVVTFANAEDGNSVLDGFTIRSGSALYGGGVSVTGASPTIRNCLITGNQSTYSGGGLFVDGGGVDLDNVVFEGNDAGGAGGAIYLKISSLTMTSGSIVSNTANNGGGIYMKDGSGTNLLTDVTFRENIAAANGGGFYLKNSEVSASNCTFDLNSATDGGGWFSYSSGDATVTASTFLSNSANGLGGAANVRSSSTVTFAQCTFDSNSADVDCDGEGGGAVLNIANSIVTLEDPMICDNVLCDVEDMFYGDDPIVVGDILDCQVSEGPGACCGGSACWSMEEVDCSAGGGSWNGPGTSCVDVTCESGGGDTTGACCVLGNCVHATESSCIDGGGVFYGTSMTCSAVSCPSSCAQDVNGDGIVGVEDLLSLIAAWGMCP
jgi:predicted outer membrane repeat protein